MITFFDFHLFLRCLRISKKDMKIHIAKSWTALNKMDWKSALSNSLKRSFFRANAESVLKYGASPWSLTKSFESKLDGIYNRMLKPRMYTQSNTPPVAQLGFVGPPPPPRLGFLICSNISKRFYLQLKAFDLLYKMRYILWVVVLLEVCDVTKHGRHLGFYQELEIR